MWRPNKGWRYTIGTLRWWQMIGGPYTQILRETLKPVLGTTAVSAFLGAKVSISIYTGLAVGIGLLLLDFVFGYLVYRHRIIHAQITNEWENNPWMLKQIELLERIAKNTDPAARDHDANKD